MKFTIARQELLQAVNTVRGIVPIKSALNILTHMLIEAENDTITLSTTDLKVSIVCTVNCAVEVPGSVTASCQRLSMILSEMPDADVEVELLNSSIVALRCGMVDTRLLSIAPEEFPPLKSFEGLEPIVYKQPTLKNLFRKTSYAICTDQSRYNLTGVLLEIRSDGTRVVATDGRRLSYAMNDEDIATDRQLKVIIPSKMVHELEALLKDDLEQYVRVYLQETHAAFVFDRVKVITALIEGTFPNYEMVIPKKQDREILFHTDSFVQCMRRAAAMTTDKYRNVKFTFTPGQMKCNVKTPEVGEFEEDLPVEYEGEQIITAFNPMFILEVLRYMDTDKVSLQMKDGGSPGVFRPYKDGAASDDYICVVMPIRA